MVAEPAALPGDHGARLDEDENVPPASPATGQPRPEKAIGDRDVRSRLAALIHGELVAQCEDLKLQGGSRSEAGAERGDKSDEDCIHEAASYPLSGIRRESLTSARAPPNSRDAGRFGILGRDNFVIFGERHLRHLLKEFVAHYHAERYHQGVGSRAHPSAAVFEQRLFDTRRDSVPLAPRRTAQLLSSACGLMCRDGFPDITRGTPRRSLLS